MTKNWTPEEEAKHLAARFEGVNQAAFARAHQVPGGASMVSQHIKGRRPINMDAALAYARGFSVPLADISPRLAKQAQEADLLSPIAKFFAEPPYPAADEVLVSLNDWALLQDVKLVLMHDEIETIRRRAAHVRSQQQAPGAPLGKRTGNGQ